MYDAQQAPGAASPGGSGMAWVGPAMELGYWKKPRVPVGQRVVFADGSGNFSEVRGGLFTSGRGRWSSYHLVDNRWHDLKIQDTCRSQSGALRFQVTVEAHWRINDPSEFLRNQVEPENYCRSRVLGTISNQTMVFAPREANIAQAQLAELSGTGMDVGNGLHVSIDNIVLLPPEGVDQLIGELDQGATQFDVDRLRRIRQDADRANDLGFRFAQEGVTQADVRDRGEEWLRRAEEPVRRAELPRRRERPALPTSSPFDDDIIDVTPETNSQEYRRDY